MTALRWLWPWVRGGLALFGAASLLSLGVFWLSLWLAPEDARRVQAPPVSPVAGRLAARITPGLQAAARAYQPTFLAHAASHGVVVRYAASRAYPVMVREIPRGAEIACDDVLSEFGTMPLTELIAAVLDHARAKGERVHPSFRGREAVPFERRSMSVPFFLPSR